MQEVPTWFDNIFVVQVGLWIAILVVVVSAVAKLWKPAKRFIEGIDTLFGSEEHDSLAERLERIETQQAEQGEKITRIRHEVLPNHGTTLRDQIDKTNRKVDKLAELQQRDYQRLKEHLKEAEHSKAVIEKIADRVDIQSDERKQDG